MPTKPKVAFYWCSSCGGCEESVIDLNEKVLDVVAEVDIVFWPCAMDTKYNDVEKMTDGEIAVCFINGAIRTSEQEHLAMLLRKKAGIVIAFGSCSCMGGVPALANLKNKESIFNRSYLNSPTVINSMGTLPKEESFVDGYRLTLPEFYQTVYKLDAVIDVDYYLPGCAPTPKTLEKTISAILGNKLPEKGSVLLPNKSLCTSCGRNKTKPVDISIRRLHRIHEVIADTENCFLAQEIICMGPATRDGCDCPCINGNMPCTGCSGPVSDADQGAKMIAALGGIFNTENDKDDDYVASQIPDPAGTFYRYSISSSLLGSECKEKK